MKTFQERFSELATSLGKNDSEIAKDIGVAKQTISSWRTGQRSPRKPVVVAIANRYNVNIGWLMGLDEPKERQTPPPQRTEHVLDAYYAQKGYAMRSTANSTEWADMIEELDERQKRTLGIFVTPSEEAMINDFRQLPKDLQKKLLAILWIFKEEEHEDAQK